MEVVEILFVIYVITLVFLCPYTKVEESFGMQALHDLLYLRTNISMYDHIYFPGVVPRSFLGCLLVGSIVSPIIYLSTLLRMDKFISQYIVRICLGLLTTLSLIKFSHCVKKVFGKHVYLRFFMICCSQFHLAFYASRALPNIYALMLVLYSLGHLVKGNQTKFVMSAGIAILVLRSELMLLFGPCLLYGLFAGYIKPRLKLLKTIITTAIISIGSSVLVDSMLWGKLIWPEFEVFYFNTILNKSGQWGSLLCTCMLLFAWIAVVVFSLPLQKVFGYQHGLMYLESTKLLLVAFIFIGLYSFLPHKELRFIIYVLPIFNLAVADVWSYLEKPMLNLRGTYLDLIMTKRKPNRISHFHAALVFGCYAHLLVNTVCSIVLILAARKNYPGGEALTRLSHMDHLINRSDVHVHICNLAAQTGVTRFLEENNKWIYNKTEGLETNFSALSSSKFTHIISEISEEEMSRELPTFIQIFQVSCFKRIRFHTRLRFWASIDLNIAPCLFIYEKKALA
ncbi:putative Dol-P-Man:Man(7)GlcNAc(2)-PP-Dol alpha-1, 6-mannosyltransferase isoform 1 [Schistosoma japonicum]|uniref:Mannosyltransferase n=3 Tax=Schistosoma japonicum TaxID=6182 RepID=A0A4Z2CZW9_SCHJA|nr:putative Dol-P-Man:Man(7)GlcNAc(2)-PP-Dol alpha-1, 6-mannosyltransferase isoform 1 [Schistosoma japonicum]